MEEIAMKIFSEGGMVYLLFFLIVGGFIWKGVPYLISLFSEMRKDFLQALKSQQDTFERTLQTLSDDFIKRVEKSDVWHEKHQEELRDIKNILIKK